MVVQRELTVQTRGRGTYELTHEVERTVQESGIRHGLCNVFVQHTSASLMLCENADPEVRRDLETFMARLAPDGDPMFRHVAEGPDDMPAHVRSVLTQSTVTIPFSDHRCLFGAWQGLYLWEHRQHPQRRRCAARSRCMGRNRG